MKSWHPLLITLAVLVVACETPGPQPPVAVNHVHPTPTSAPTPTPAVTASPVPSSPATAIDRCHTKGLTISHADTQGAAGTIVDTFRVLNSQQSPCWLYGFPGLLMLTGPSQAPMKTRVVRNGGFFSTQAGPSRFVLQPGAAASFQVAWSDVPHGTEGFCQPASWLEITPPDEYDHIIIPTETFAGWMLAPCNGGELDVTPIRAAGTGVA